MTFNARYHSTDDPFPIFYSGCARGTILAERPWLIIEWPDLTNAFKPSFPCPWCSRLQYVPGPCLRCQEYVMLVYRPMAPGPLFGIVVTDG